MPNKIRIKGPTYGEMLPHINDTTQLQSSDTVLLPNNQNNKNRVLCCVLIDACAKSRFLTLCYVGQPWGVAEALHLVAFQAETNIHRTVLFLSSSHILDVRECPNCSVSRSLVNC